jgi:3-deoxy-manno-octulosonate cytidylyltransferase (CMP-KDO synthetase)
MNVLIVIPARFASTRFPGKPLAMIGGKSMIQRVYKQALKTSLTEHIYVATDDDRIYNHVQEFGGKVCMTSPSHQSGTDRCAEVLAQLDIPFDLVVNIQGDEPFILPQQIDDLVKLFQQSQVEIGTLCKHIIFADELYNPSCVKVVKASDNKALYFSRHPIPFQRMVNSEEWLGQHKYYKHLGIYAYQPEILKAITKLEVSSLERAESLEQLRWLENGYSIYVSETDFQSVAIDTPDDLELAEQYLASIS